MYGNLEVSVAKKELNATVHNKDAVNITVLHGKELKVTENCVRSAEQEELS